MAKETIFVDTSAWYATIDKNDRDHMAAVAKIQNLDHPLVTSNYIFDETLTLLKTRLNSTIAIQFGQKLWNNVNGKVKVYQFRELKSVPPIPLAVVI